MLLLAVPPIGCSFQHQHSNTAVSSGFITIEKYVRMSGDTVSNNFTYVAIEDWLIKPNGWIMIPVGEAIIIVTKPW